MPPLSPLVVSLLVVASFPPLAAAASGRSTLERSATAQATNAERAKMGLLPRRAARARVTYLSGAAGPGKAAASLAALDEQPVTLVVEDADASAAAAGTLVVAAAEAVVADATPVAAGPVVQEVPRDAPVVAPDPAVQAAPSQAPVVAAGPVIQDVPKDAPAAPAPPAASVAAPAPAPATGSSEELAAPSAPDASPPAATGVKEASPTAGAAAQPVAVERVIDGDGEVVVRVVGPGSVVLGERVVGSLVDLPVVSSRRQDDGTVVQTVEDEWGVIEVRRDAVGRFVSAKPAEARTSTVD